MIVQDIASVEGCGSGRCVVLPTQRTTARPMSPGVVCSCRKWRLSYLPDVLFYGRSSYGAPVPEEPANSLVPSGSVTSRPLALLVPSIAR